MYYNGEFKGKIGILIGCSRTTGIQLARRYLEEGMRLVIADLNPDIVGLAEDLKSEFDDAEVYGEILDVTNDADVESFYARIDKKFGRIDMLHYNAGLIAPLMPIEELPMKYFDSLYSVNVRGVALSIKFAAPIMRKQGDGGSIVTTSSWYGRKGYGEAAAYCSSKAACINLTQVAAIELGKYKIKVNTIAPGDVDSPMTLDSMRIRAELDGVPYEELLRARNAQHPLGKMATFTDVANVALFCSSSQNGHTTGQTIYVAGGAQLCF
jgi:NAD(P)-dependent dehydrogenase (short-subunit alcohol dehydrogenase family)